MKIFWSWQSDLPGKTNRHFVKGALEDAIAALKESADAIVEPSEREKLDALHLDHDRKGVPGSPDLAATIFEKIEAASVFVADVSTVAELEREGENGEPFIKQVMNPNVAIELGYALHACGTQKLIMVMNALYGGRDGLPFDLKHKAGPIFFNLAPNADKATMKAARAKLAKQFETALRPYVTDQRSPTQAVFEPVKTNETTGLFFPEGRTLATVRWRRIRDGGKDQKCVFTPYKYYSVRMIPKTPLRNPFQKIELRNFLNTEGPRIYPLTSRPPIIQANEYGAISFHIYDETARPKFIGSLVQLLENGELWSVTCRYNMNALDNKKLAWVRWFATDLHNILYSNGLFMKQILGIQMPFDLEFRAKGLKGLWLHWTGGEDHQFIDDVVEWKGELTDLKPETIHRVCLIISEKLFDATGNAVPDDFWREEE